MSRSVSAPIVMVAWVNVRGDRRYELHPSIGAVFLILCCKKKDCVTTNERSSSSRKRQYEKLRGRERTSIIPYLHNSSTLREAMLYEHPSIWIIRLYISNCLVMGSDPGIWLCNHSCTKYLMCAARYRYYVHYACMACHITCTTSFALTFSSHKIGAYVQYSQRVTRSRCYSVKNEVVSHLVCKTRHFLYSIWVAGRSFCSFAVCRIGQFRLHRAILNDNTAYVLVCSTWFLDFLLDAAGIGHNRINHLAYLKEDGFDRLVQKVY